MKRPSAYLNQRFPLRFELSPRRFFFAVGYPGGGLYGCPFWSNAGCTGTHAPFCQWCVGRGGLCGLFCIDRCGGECSACAAKTGAAAVISNNPTAISTASPATGRAASAVRCTTRLEVFAHSATAFEAAWAARFPELCARRSPPPARASGRAVALSLRFSATPASPAANCSAAARSCTASAVLRRGTTARVSRLDIFSCTMIV